MKLRSMLIALTILPLFFVSPFTLALEHVESTENTLNLTVATPPPAATNNRPLIIPQAPNVDAKGYVLMDFNSGRIIAEKNMNQRMAPASLTKLMTLYIAAEALSQGQIKLTDKVHVSAKAWRMGGSKMFLKAGSEVSVKDLLEGIVVASGNDACVALAQYIAGNETSFADIMNNTAKMLGMKNTHYIDSTGLPNPQHYSTPYDIALLTRAWIKNFPQYYSWFKQKWIKYDGIRQPNRNRLLWRDPSVDGLKTGHTKNAGYCLVSSALRDGMRLISVVMGTPSDRARANISEALLNWGYRFYNTKLLFSANTPITNPRVWMAKHKHIPLGVIEPLYVTAPRGQLKNIKIVVKLNPSLKAPIVKGKTYGVINVTLNNKVIEQTPLVALDDDKQGGIFTRLWDRLVLTIKGWF